MTFVTRVVAASAILLGLTAGANADVLYDNLSQTPTLSDPLSGPDATIYASFSTSTSLDLTDVELLLSGGTNSGSALVVTLFSDTGSGPSATPLTTIRTIADSQIDSTTPTAYDFQLSGSGYALTAGTRYWIGVSDSGTAQWFYNYPLSGGTDVASEFNYTNPTTGYGLLSNSGGDSAYQMCVVGNGGAGSCSLPSGQTTVQVFAQDTPEPASLAILGIAVLGLGVARRRYKA